MVGGSQGGGGQPLFFELFHGVTAALGEWFPGVGLVGGALADDGVPEFIKKGDIFGEAAGEGADEGAGEDGGGDLVVVEETAVEDGVFEDADLFSGGEGGFEALVVATGFVTGLA